jgi:DNA-directed RNA polymerase specialized sigma subunit
MDNKEIGMPGSPNRNTSSPQERILTQRELTTNTILEWISEEQSRIFHTRLEVTQIESALNALTQQERFIIECKYFEGMNWRSIEVNVNSKYREVNYITEAGIRKINSKALDKIKIVLDSFYDNLHIA